MPKVTVAVPLYNNSRTIERCLKSVFDQSFTDYELVVSNDHSTDNSLALAEHLLCNKKNARIITPEQKQYYNNFPFLMSLAKTEYFVWLAGDDYWEPEFLSETVRALDTNQGIICAVPKCRHIDDNGATAIAVDTFPLKEDLQQNTINFFERGLNNNRMYGVFRSAAITGCYPTKIMHAQDFVFTLKTLSRGCYEEIDGVLMNRELTPLRKYAESVQRDHRFFLFRLFPFLVATFHVLWDREIPKTMSLLLKLFKQNYIMHHRQVKYVYGRYGRVTRPIYNFINNYLIWRI